MPKIERWENFPDAVRQHLIERMRDRAIGIADLHQLRLWIDTKPEVPEGDWYKDFASFSSDGVKKKSGNVGGCPYFPQCIKRRSRSTLAYATKCPLIG